jgi:hypothetical protein
VLKQVWLKLSEGAPGSISRLLKPAFVAELGLRTYAKSTIFFCNFEPEARLGASAGGCILATVLQDLMLVLD